MIKAPVSTVREIIDEIKAGDNVMITMEQLLVVGDWISENSIAKINAYAFP